MVSSNEALDSKPRPLDAGAGRTGRRLCPVILSNLWHNTKPHMPTSVRAIFLLFQCLLVVVGFFSGMEVYKLDDPWSAPMLNFACIAFGISELGSLLFALRKPQASA